MSLEALKHIGAEVKKIDHELKIMRGLESKLVEKREKLQSALEVLAPGIKTLPVQKKTRKAHGLKGKLRSPKSKAVLSLFQTNPGRHFDCAEIAKFSGVLPQQVSAYVKPLLGTGQCRRVDRGVYAGIAA